MFDDSDSNLLTKKDIDELETIYKNKSLEDYFNSSTFKKLCSHSTQSIINLAEYYGNYNLPITCAIYMALWQNDKVFEIPENHKTLAAQQYLQAFTKISQFSQNIIKSIENNNTNNNVNDTHYYLVDLVDRFADIFASETPQNPKFVSSKENNTIGIKAELNNKSFQLNINVDSFLISYKILYESYPEYANLFRDLLTDQDNLKENLDKVLSIHWRDFLDMKKLEKEQKNPKTIKPTIKQYELTKYTINDNLSTNSIIGLTATLLISSAASLLLTKKTPVKKIKIKKEQQQQIEENDEEEQIANKKIIK